MESKYGGYNIVQLKDINEKIVDILVLAEEIKKITNTNSLDNSSSKILNNTK